MKEERATKKVLRGIRIFAFFFATIAFVITCCTILFVKTLARDAGLTLTAENIHGAAKFTFWNAAFLSLLFTLIDMVRRKLTVEGPVKRINAAAEKIVQGDFSARIKGQGGFGADDTFRQIVDCFNKMAEELGSVETLRTDFIANVSHEMKTPLAVIQNYSALLQVPDLSEERRMEYAKGVSDASRRMANMMTNILKLNSLENQKIYPMTKEFDLGEQLCESLLQYENVWETSNIEIETDIQENVRVSGDGELLRLVWNNLFSNAFKFTEPGGTVSVILKADEKQAIVQVRDTGCGMTPEVGAHIFEKFYQGDKSHAAAGNGLGLALVKRVIDIMHGEISVESAIGVGTTFTVKIRRC